MTVPRSSTLDCESSSGCTEMRRVLCFSGPPLLGVQELASLNVSLLPKTTKERGDHPGSPCFEPWQLDFCIREGRDTSFTQNWENASVGSTKKSCLLPPHSTGLSLTLARGLFISQHTLIGTHTYQTLSLRHTHISVALFIPPKNNPGK